MKIKGVDIFLLLGLFFFMNSCITEDREDCGFSCPQSSQLAFIYNGDGTTDIFDSKIKNVRVYIFDTDGSFVKEYNRSENELNAFQGIIPDIEPGTYDVICWGNITSLSQIISNEGGLNDHYLYNSFYLKDQPITNFDSLYYGYQRIQVPANNCESDTVYFTSAHIDIDIYIDGLSSTSETGLRAVNDPQGWLIIRNIHVGYDFEMETTGEFANMYPSLQLNTENNILTAGFNLLRFRKQNPIVIDIYNGEGDLVYSLGLTNFLTNNNIEVEGVNELTIPIYIRFDGVNVQVSVKEWESEDIDPIV